MVLAITEQNRNFEKETEFIKKIHRKFAHAKSFKIERFLENSTMFRNVPRTKLHMLIDKTTDECEVCKEEADRKRRPKNATIRAVEFNESVAIDLTEWWDEKGRNKYTICHVKATEAMGVQKYPVCGIDKLAELTHEEETWERSVIGKLQWSAQSHRPDLCYVLGQALGNLTSKKKKATLIECNEIIDRYHEHEDMNLIFQALGENLELEVYGDSAFKEYNH